jgi:hypothetical protein
MTAKMSTAVRRMTAYGRKTPSPNRANQPDQFIICRTVAPSSNDVKTNLSLYGTLKASNGNVKMVNSGLYPLEARRKRAIDKPISSRIFSLLKSMRGTINDNSNNKFMAKGTLLLL